MNDTASANPAKLSLHSQNAVAETLLFALYARALESREPGALIRDDTAAALVERIDYDFAHFQLGKFDRLAAAMRVREFDRHAHDFLARHARATVVHIGCGLDTRFERLGLDQADADRVAWYDLDLPEVIALRRQLLPEGNRRRYIACSVLDTTWMEAVRASAPRPTLFLAEGVFPYFEEIQVKSLFRAFQARFPGAELVCDAMSPLMVWLNNRQLQFAKVGARLHWALAHGRDPESWAPGIHLLDEWYYFEQHEPRMGAAGLMRYLAPLAKGVGIYHYQLG